MNWRGGRRKLIECLTSEVLKRLEVGSKEDTASQAGLDPSIALSWAELTDSIERLLTVDNGHFKGRFSTIDCSTGIGVYAWCCSSAAHGTYNFSPFHKNRDSAADSERSWWRSCSTTYVAILNTSSPCGTRSRTLAKDHSATKTTTCRISTASWRRLLGWTLWQTVRPRNIRNPVLNKFLTSPSCSAPKSYVALHLCRRHPRPKEQLGLRSSSTSDDRPVHIRRPGNVQRVPLRGQRRREFWLEILAYQFVVSVLGLCEARMVRIKHTPLKIHLYQAVSGNGTTCIVH